MKAWDSGNVAVLAEKPSVARDVARTLGATQSGEGYLHGNGYVVTWAIGHLVALARTARDQPELEDSGGATRCACCRANGRCRSTTRRATQFQVVRKILNSPRSRP